MTFFPDFWKLNAQYFLDVKCLEDINKENRYIIAQRIRWLDGIINSMPWLWVNSGRWCKSGKLGVLQSTGSQTVGHNWATDQQQITQKIVMVHHHQDVFFSNWSIFTSCIGWYVKRVLKVKLSLQYTAN